VDFEKRSAREDLIGYYIFASLIHLPNTKKIVSHPRSPATNMQYLSLKATGFHLILILLSVGFVSASPGKSLVTILTTVSPFIAQRCASHR